MKHRFRRALAAAAVLAASLVVGTATPAQATDYTHWVRVNNTFVIVNANTDFPGYTTAHWYGASFDPDADPTDWPPQSYDVGDTQTTGGSATLYLDNYWMYGGPEGSETCEASEGNPTHVRVEIRNSSNVQVGSTDWLYELGSSGWGPCESLDWDSKTVYFDNDPLDGDNSDGVLSPGTYHVYLKLEGGGNDSGADSEGAHGAGPNYSEHTTRGTFTVAPAYQYLSGISADGNSESEVDAAEADAGASGATKTFSIIRDFQSTWVNPSQSARTRHFAEDHKVVLWSAKPKDKDVSYTCNQNGGAVEECTPGDSPWDKSAANSTNTGAGVVSIRTQIRELQDIAKDNDLPWIGYTISHEPHDDAIITNNGFYGTTAKCGTRSGGVGSGNAGGGSDPCDGTAQDFKDLYATMMDRKMDSCGAGGDPTGTGSECDRVKIIYIGVGSNMYDATAGTDYVGEDDQMRPDVNDFDLFGADTYNYACFNDTGWDDTGGVISGGTTLTEVFDDIASPFGGAATSKDLGDFTSADVGATIRGTGIPANTTITAVNATTHTATLSQAATNGSGVNFQVYRNGLCTDEDADKWRSFQETVDDNPSHSVDENDEKISVIGLARHFNKKVVIAEYASHPGCDGVEYVADLGCQGSATDNDDNTPWANEFDRAEWFQQMYDWLTSDPRPAAHLVGFVYFHSSGTPNAADDHDWRFLPANNHTSDPTYVAKGTVGRSTWQSTFGSDAQFLSDSRNWTGSLIP